MKKLLLYCFLFFCFFATLQAQQKNTYLEFTHLPFNEIQRLQTDSMLVETGTEARRIGFKYDPQNRLVAIIDSSFDGNKLSRVRDLQLIHFPLKSVAIIQNKNFLPFTYESMERYTIDSSNIRELKELNEVWIDSKWVENQKRYFLYDASGRLIELWSEKWDFIKKIWEKEVSTTYNFDIKGNLLKRLESGWSIQMNKWQVINEYSYTYNVVGQKLTETWLNLQNNTLQPVNRSNYIYDASGRLDSIKNYQVFSGNWVYQYLITLDDSPEQQILQKGKYFNINPQGQATLSTQNFITPGPKIYTDQPALEEIKKFVPATQTFDPSERISNAYTLLPNGVVKGEYSIERYQNNNWETTRKIQGWMSKLNTVFGQQKMMLY